MSYEKEIEALAEKIGKDSRYMKGLVTKEKNDLIDRFGDALSEERIESLAFSAICKKYDIPDEEPESEPEIIDDSDDVIGEIIEDVDMDDIEDIDIDDEKSAYETPDNESAWSDILGSVPMPTEGKVRGKFERTPSLIVELGPTYYLKTILEEPPFEHEFEGKYGTYTKTAIKVELVKVSDTALYDVKYSKGDFAGQKAFVNGKKYTLWMDEKCLGHYTLFWMKHRGVPVPDNRVFTFKYTKKGNYNVWKFGTV